MIHFIVATDSEARPVIDLFKLKKFLSSKVIIYNNKEISVTITGIGKLNSAIGVTQTFYEFSKVINSCWINLGLAGHKAYKLGKIFSVKKIQDTEDMKSYYPYVSDFNIEYEECLTLGKQKKEYSSKLYDMESSGFFQAANKFSSKELIQFIKIISDNRLNSIDFRNKKEVYDLIIGNKKKISGLCNYLKEVKEIVSIKNKEFIDKQYLDLSKKISFTFTEEVQFKSLLNLYYSKYSSLKKNAFNKDENAKYNINKLKNILKL